ncbi:efflux RND transporter periplasmic adaptor subunit [bacterium]|nr:efflux RND transporter periplasmic adaptor subunit [bacterium]
MMSFLFPSLKTSRRLKLLISAVVIAIVAVPIIYVVHRATAAEGGKGGPGGPGQMPPPEVAYVTMKSERVTITTELPGRTSPLLVAEVRPQVSGIILKRLFREGADVKEGDLLYQIDPAVYQAAVENAEANLNAAKKAVDRAVANLKSAQANVVQQKATLEYATTNLKRMDALAKKGVISPDERDKASTAARVAEALSRNLESQVSNAREAVAEAEAAVKQAEAAVKTAKINLDYTKITAPISGRIGMSNVTVGALVTAHQAVALTSIQQLDPIFVDVPQSTAELLRLRRSIERNKTLDGDQNTMRRVRLILEDGQPYSKEGTLEFRDVTVDPSTGSVTFRMVFPNPDTVLLPGMFVRAIITEGVSPKALRVPQQAVSRDTKAQPIAMVVNAAGKVEQRILKLDRAMGDQWLVQDGLAEGDRVIVEGLQKVRPGAEVKAVPFKQAQAAVAADQTTKPATDMK